MGTRNFNILDKILAVWRFRQPASMIVKNDRVLDFGCGYQAYFLRKVKNIIELGIGIDYEAENQIIGNNIKILKYTYKNKIPFPDKYFSKVIMLAVIEHFFEKDLYILFHEIYRVLKSDGKIILSTPTTFGKRILDFLAIKLRLISSKEISDHKKYYSKQDFEKIAFKTGLVIERYKKFQLGINSLCVLKKMNK